MAKKQVEFKNNIFIKQEIFKRKLRNILVKFDLSRWIVDIDFFSQRETERAGLHGAILFQLSTAFSDRSLRVTGQWFCPNLAIKKMQHQ
ncbi:MAG: hypothetical protein MUC94_11350 [bacterium]|nr:hypothetical protein [bacterium]